MSGRILLARQRCPSCRGERTSDWFGMCEPLACSMCDGTGFDPRLPPLDYVLPEQLYHYEDLPHAERN